MTSASGTIPLEYVRPYLYPKQYAAIYDQHRYSVIEATTKAGKTAGCITWLIEKALAGRSGQNFWWVAPVSDQSLIAFRRAIRALPQDLYMANISLRTITLVNGTVIWFKSGDKPNSLFGEDVYGAVIDEASRFKEEAYIAVRSTLTYTRGQLRIIGNVRGRRNFFYKMARRAEHGDPEMGYHKIVAADAVAAGVLDAKEIEDARTQMPEQSWRELYLAEPSDDGGNPFGLQHIAGCVVPQLSSSAPMVWGWDLAKRQDYTVGVALDRVGYVCRFERLQHMPWPDIIKHIITCTGSTPALVDSTGLGDPVLDYLQRTPGSRFEGYHFNPASKQKLMEGLAVAIQSRAVTYPPGVLVQELEQFEFLYTKTGVRYCLAPDTPILTADLRWVACGNLTAGDRIAAFDEFPCGGGRKGRRWRSAEVIAAEEIVRPCYRVIFDEGTEVIASDEHLWLTDLGQSGERGSAWIKTKDLRGLHPTSRSNRFAPHRILKLLDVWQEDRSFEAGYLAAAFDGEGSLHQGTRNDHFGNTLRLSFSQRENEMALQVRRFLAAKGFAWSESHNGNGAGTCINFWLTGGRHETLRFLGQIRPRRLLPKLDLDRLGHLYRKQDAKVVAVEPLGLRTVVAIGTTTKTLIAAGMASHNSAPDGYYDDCVIALALAVQHKSHVVMPLNITAAMVQQIRAQPPRLRR